MRCRNTFRKRVSRRMRHTVTCKQVREGLREYLDAAAPPGIAADMEQHLQGCTPCRDYAHDLGEIPRLLSALSRPPMPAEMKATLLAAFRRHPSA